MKRKIVIMGTRRSGSTFIGKLLTNSSNAFAYVEEPFNPVRGIKNLNHLWYPYINQGNHHSIVKTDLQKLLDLKSVKFKNSIVKDRKSTRLNSSHVKISYAVFCLKKKIKQKQNYQTAARHHQYQLASSISCNHTSTTKFSMALTFLCRQIRIGPLEHIRCRIPRHI